MIVGGGVIGTEYASILATLGVPVVLIDKRPRLLEFVDAEIIDALQQEMKDIGLTLYHEEEVVAIKKDPEGRVLVSLQKTKPITVSTLMYAIGRVGATKGLASGPGRDRAGRTRTPRRQRAFPDVDPTYLCGRRHHRLPRLGILIDATGQARRLSCIRPGRPDGHRAAALRHLFHSGNIYGRPAMKKNWARPVFHSRLGGPGTAKLRAASSSATRRGC